MKTLILWLLFMDRVQLTQDFRVTTRSQFVLIWSTLERWKGESTLLLSNAVCEKCLEFEFVTSWIFICTVTSFYVRNRRQILLLILSEFKRINRVLLPRFFDDFRGNRNYLLHSNVFNIRNEIWWWSLKVKMNGLSYGSWQNFASDIKLVRELINFYPPWNHQKTLGFLMISGGIEVILFL